jgi:fibrillarin-like pre-rRNA processing protein
MQDLLVVAQTRKNIIPLMADARKPERYLPLVEKVDIIYPVLCRNQGKIHVYYKKRYYRHNSCLQRVLNVRCSGAILRQTDE